MQQIYKLMLHCIYTAYLENKAPKFANKPISSSPDSHVEILSNNDSNNLLPTTVPRSCGLGSALNKMAFPARAARGENCAPLIPNNSG